MIIANSAPRASLAIYHLISNARLVIIAGEQKKARRLFLTSVVSGTFLKRTKRDLKQNVAHFWHSFVLIYFIYLFIYLPHRISYKYNRKDNK